MKPTRTILALLFAVATVGCDGFVTFGGGSGDDDDDYTDPPGGDGSDRSLYFYYGPMKPMFAETILYSIETITGHDFGGWDFTAPDPGSQAFSDVGNASGYYPYCRLLGGCMEHRIPQARTSFIGTAYVLQLEKAVAEACYDRAAYGMFPGGVAPDGALQARDVIDYQYLAVYGELPSDRDLELSMDYFQAHLSDPEFGDVSAIESAGRGHCRALLTTNRFLFY